MSAQSGDSSQRVLVTGGASGIGEAVAQAALARGWRVAVLDRDQAAIDRLTAGTDAQLTAIACDVTEQPVLAGALERAGDFLGGPPNQLIACAGIFPVCDALSIDAQQWRQVMDINVFGVFAVAQGVCRALVAADEPGSLVFVSSNAAYIGFNWDPAAHYSASKGALIALARQLAVEWAHLRIRVNCVAPGVVETPALRMMDDPYRAQHYLNDSVPMQRTGLASEIAATCLFLSGPDSSYVTGQTLVADGGAVCA